VEKMTASRTGSRSIRTATLRHRPEGLWVWDAAGKHIGTTSSRTARELDLGEPDYSVLYITATTSVYISRRGLEAMFPTSNIESRKLTGTSSL